MHEYRGVRHLIDTNPTLALGIMLALCRRHSRSGLCHTVHRTGGTFYASFIPKGKREDRWLAHANANTVGGVTLTYQSTQHYHDFLKRDGWTSEDKRTYRPPQKHCEACPERLVCHTRSIG